MRILVSTLEQIVKQSSWFDKEGINHSIIISYLRPWIKAKMKTMIGKANNNIELQRILVVVFNMNNIIYVRLLLYLRKRITNWHSCKKKTTHPRFD